MTLYSTGIAGGKSSRTRASGGRPLIGGKKGGKKKSSKKSSKKKSPKKKSKKGKKSKKKSVY